jgi:hypothetical protein
MPKVVALVVSCCLFVLPPRVFPQTSPRQTLTGSVVDAATKEPLPGVNVFLAGTTLGATTGLDGAFTVRNVPSGAYEIVASIPGYNREVQRVFIPHPADRPLRIALTERLIEAEGVEVTGERRGEWERNLERFRQALFAVR